MKKLSLLFFFFVLFFHYSSYAVEFVLFTQPKTGTHLLSAILEELSGKTIYYPKNYMKIENLSEDAFATLSTNSDYLFFSPGFSCWKRKTMDTIWRTCKRKNFFLHLHVPYSLSMEQYLAEKGAITFFVQRDPRDQIISLLNHYKHINFSNKKIKELSSDEERLLFMIENNLRQSILAFKDWATSPLCCVLEFCKLMGSHGGEATDADAIEELRKIANALQQDLSDESLEQIYRKHFGHGWSFFKGTVGAWKGYFTEPLKKATKKAIGDLLIELGYEKDYNW